MRWLAVTLVFGVLAGLVFVELGGTDGKPLSPEPPKHEAVQARANLQTDRHRFLLIAQAELDARLEAERLEAARLEAERLRAVEAEKRRRAAEQRRTPTRTTQPHTAPSPVSSGDVWHRLAMCETGGTMNPRAYNPAGPYYSFFQFGAPDWRRAGGGPGLPWDYSYAEQLRVAQNWQRLVGWKAWPYCSRKLGLR